MAIRLRVVDGKMIALCAAKTVAQEGDIYLGDDEHYALMCKFAREWDRWNDPYIDSLARTQEMDDHEMNELLMDEIGKINSELDRLHGVVYDFHQIGALEAVKQVVDEVEKLRQALEEQDVNWATLQLTHPHLVGPQRDEIRDALISKKEAVPVCVGSGGR